MIQRINTRYHWGAEELQNQHKPPPNPKPLHGSLDNSHQGMICSSDASQAVMLETGPGQQQYMIQTKMRDFKISSPDPGHTEGWKRADLVLTEPGFGGIAETVETRL